MKVEEAKKKHSPYPDSIGGCICIANECMAWRWVDPAIKSEGYCGLAGKEEAE